MIPINNYVLDAGPRPGQPRRRLVQVRPAIAVNRQITAAARKAVRGYCARVESPGTGADRIHDQRLRLAIHRLLARKVQRETPALTLQAVNGSGRGSTPGMQGAYRPIAVVNHQGIERSVPTSWLCRNPAREREPEGQHAQSSA